MSETLAGRPKAKAIPLNMQVRHDFSPFFAPFSWGTQKREAAAPKASACFMGETCAVEEEPGKQKPRSCRAQELARSSAQENAWQKKTVYST